MSYFTYAAKVFLPRSAALEGAGLGDLGAHQIGWLEDKSKFTIHDPEVHHRHQGHHLEPTELLRHLYAFLDGAPAADRITTGEIYLQRRVGG